MAGMPDGPRPEFPLIGARAYPPNHEDRTRYVRMVWPREPDGKILAKPGPRGVRTVNDMIWGHDLDEFFYINRFPNGDLIVQTCWSRSMIKAYGENYEDEAWKTPESDAVPHLRKPWPVIKIKDVKGSEIHQCLIEMTLFEVGEIGQIFVDCGRFETREDDPAEMDRDEDMRVDDPVTSDAQDATDDETNVDAVAKSTTDAVTMATSGDTKAGEAQSCETDEDQPMDGASEEENEAEDNDTKQDLSTNSSGNDSASCSSDNAKPLEPLSRGGSGTSSYKTQGHTIAQDTLSAKWKYKPYSMPKALEPANRNSPFSVEDIPKLEEYIPFMYIPDYLLVHDPHNVVACNDHDESEAELPSVAPPPIKYKRIRPQNHFEPTKLPAAMAATVRKFHEPIAHLYLHQKNRFGVGHHSLVYRAPLQLPEPLTARSRNGRVTVAAKLAMYNTDDRNMLKQEAEIYDKIPKHMSDEYCGFNFVAPIPYPVPVGAVVPKFYGYYEPVRDENYRSGASPILLLEECGRPIEPTMLTADQRTECLSLMYRLHLEDIIQNSFYIRNILRQPGPLHVAPEKRSDDTPSFRVIDFGRAEKFDPNDNSSIASIRQTIREEERLAKKQLGLDYLGF